MFLYFCFMESIKKTLEEVQNTDNIILNYLAIGVWEYSEIKNELINLIFCLFIIFAGSYIQKKFRK